MATLTIARPQTVLQVLKKALNVLAECNVINETVPVKKPRTCILPAPCLSECLPESTVVQVLVQRAHRQCVVSDTIFDVIDLPPPVTVAASVSSFSDLPPQCDSL
jgi:hypothetical protein